MAETADLPEEIILNIFSRLPVKSLIRFTTVSKHLHFIILSDPKFAQSHLKAARHLSRRLLFSTDAPQLESLPLDDPDTPSFGDPSSVRKLTFPFLQQCHHVQLLGSCSGLVFLACHVTLFQKLFYIWNPSLGFLKELPDSGFSSDRYPLWYYGAAYLSPADDYKFLITSCHLRNDDVRYKLEVGMFSLRTHSWKRIESPGSPIVLEPLSPLGIRSNDSLHWLDYDVYDLLCFDLTEEVFRRMQLPSFDNGGVNGVAYSKLGVCGSCLCVSRLPVGVCDSIDLWVMKEYGVSDSWTMLFSLKLSDPPDMPLSPTEVLVLESSMVVKNWTPGGYDLIRIDHKEDNKLTHYMTEGRQCFMVEYEETLLWISGYQSVKESEQGQILETDSQRRN